MQEIVFYFFYFELLQFIPKSVKASITDIIVIAKAIKPKSLGSKSLAVTIIIKNSTKYLTTSIKEI